MSKSLCICYHLPKGLICERVCTSCRSLQQRHSEIESLRTEVQSLRGTVNARNESITKLQQQLTALKDDTCTKSQRVEQQGGQIETLNHQVEEWKSLCSAQESALVEWRDKYSASTATCGTLADKLATTEQLNKNLHEQIQLLNGQMEHSTRDNIQAEQQLQELRHKLQACRARQDSTVAQLQISQSGNTALLQQLAELKHELRNTSRAAEEARLVAAQTQAKEKKAHCRLAVLLKTEQEMQVAVAKLLKAHTAMEGSFTCVQCVKMFHEPVTCVPW